jgi:uncharacterized heparinase superfamily protein
VDDGSGLKCENVKTLAVLLNLAHRTAGLVSSFTGRIRKRHTASRPFQCHDCGWRGWLRPLQTCGSDSVVAKIDQSVDLTSLDGMFGGESRRKSQDPVLVGRDTDALTKHARPGGQGQAGIGAAAVGWKSGGAHRGPFAGRASRLIVASPEKPENRMSTLTFATLRRALGKPPSAVLRRVAREAGTGIDRLNAGRRARRFDVNALLRATKATSLEGLWDRLADRPLPFTTEPVDLGLYDDLCPGDTDRILTLAERAAAHEVELLGSGPINLGPTIDWLTDHKTGHGWPPAFMRDIDCDNLDRNSDVKFPWELSRLQWLIPAGQAFLLTGEERYARATRDVIDHWIAENPYARTVNWSSTMEVALRIVSWTWLFHALSQSESWADEGFRGRFLTTLFLHGRFTAKYFEDSGHVAADGAGLVFAGLFFGKGTEPARWLNTGRTLLDDEISNQVTADGVHHEGSTAYHRVALELFLLPAMYLGTCGVPSTDQYRQRLGAMARFVAAYSRRDGTTPLWGDADDGRVLPLGGQALTDHRYLIGLVALGGDDTLLPFFSGPTSEIFWTLGEAGVRRLMKVRRMDTRSCAFKDGGYFVMRNASDHVFIDCAPVGLDGQGGHGHNDCLSFEAELNGVLLVTDCGAYVYTASAEERNRFRSSSSHNTPRIDGEEVNRFVAADNLWRLHADAVPELRQWKTSNERDVFVGSHSGYLRLDRPVQPVRTIELNHRLHALLIQDRFDGEGVCDVEIPLHLASHVRVERFGPAEVRLTAKDKRFRLTWTAPGWKVALEAARVSPRYGVALNSRRLVWRGRTGSSLSVVIQAELDAARLPGL